MVTCPMAFRPLCLWLHMGVSQRTMCGSFIRSGAVILLLPLSFSLPRIGAQEMRQNSDKYMSLWFICGKKELITKISKSTETLRNIGRLSVTPCMYIWMEYLEKVLHVTYTHLFAQCTSFCVPGVTSETDHTLFIVLTWDICMRSARQNPISHYLFIDDLVHFTQY